MLVCLHFQCVTPNPRFLLPLSKPPDPRLSASNSRLLASLLFVYFLPLCLHSWIHFPSFMNPNEFTFHVSTCFLLEHSMIASSIRTLYIDPTLSTFVRHNFTTDLHSVEYTHYKVRETNSLNSINFRLNKIHLITPRVFSSSSYLLIQQFSQQRSRHSCRGSKGSWLSTVKADRASLHRGLVNIHSFGCTKQLIPGSSEQAVTTSHGVSQHQSHNYKSFPSLCLCMFIRGSSLSID